MGQLDGKIAIVTAVDLESARESQRRLSMKAVQWSSPPATATG